VNSCRVAVCAAVTLFSSLTWAQVDSSAIRSAAFPISPEEMRATTAALRNRVGVDGFTQKMVDDLAQGFTEVSATEWKKMPADERATFLVFYRDIGNFAHGRTNGTAIVAKLKDAELAELSIQCMNRLQRIGVAFSRWAQLNSRKFPFNVDRAHGGTLELCAVGADGFDQNSVFHFQALSNQLSYANVLMCPLDAANAEPKHRTVFSTNASYKVHTGTNVNTSSPFALLAWCPFHKHVLLCDGSIRNGRTAAASNAVAEIRPVSNK
jgi:hypothetical protein